MSSQAVEARSLKSLTALASNPPPYPRNPTHVKHEPLVLYIARVPGSRDVFLTPLKPREKIVTAEDITSSVYFVHVEQPEDAQLIAYSEQRPTSADGSPTPSIQRKAVPTAPTRKPVPGALAPIGNSESRQNINAGNHAQRPVGPGPNYTPRHSSDMPQNRSENERPLYSTQRPGEQSRPIGTILTLIRRDPGSGAQWNVAQIEDPPVVEVSSTALNDPTAKKKIGAPLYIEIFNPGYSKFLHSDSISRPLMPPRPSDLSIRSYQSDIRSQPHVTDPYLSDAPIESGNTFRRRLWMEGSQHTSGGFGHRMNTSRDLSSGRPGSRGSYNSHSDRLSTDHRPSLSRSFVSATDQGSEKHSFFRGYVFTSPWNGRCEFVTGVSGGSLKCRHIVPGLQGAPPSAMPVSELRFNLPNSLKPPSPRSEESSKRPSLFHRHRHSRNTSSMTVNSGNGTEYARNSLDRLDLSLGQEYAGGGLGGKHAKLGKLILEDEGLKMMDLLVAANIALWWRAYEKAFSGRRGNDESFQAQ